MVVKKKIVKLEVEDLVELESDNLFRKGYKKKVANPHFDISNKVSKEAYRNMSGKDKKIHQGFKDMMKDNE